MPRIAHVISTPAGIGGAERVLEALCEGGRARGWEQLVLNPFAHDPDRAALRGHIADALYVGRSCAHPWELPGARSWLRREIAEFGADILHVHLFHAEALAASLRGPHPRILTHHHGDFLEFEGRRFESKVDRWAGARFDRVVAVSEWSARLLRDRFGYPADRISTIPNGWSGSPRARPSEAGDVVVCVANLRREKGHDLLLRAFARVLVERPDAQLRIVGDGPERKALEGLASQIGVSRSVTWLGRVDPPWEELGRADVFALGSRVEPLGIAALEAMAAGLPVVAPRVGGLADLVQDGKSGVLVEPGDEEGMAKAIERLLVDPEGARRMGRAGVAAAACRSGAAMVDAYFALYEELT